MLKCAKRGVELLLHNGVQTGSMTVDVFAVRSVIWNLLGNTLRHCKIDTFVCDGLFNLGKLTPPRKSGCLASLNPNQVSIAYAGIRNRNSAIQKLNWQRGCHPARDCAMISRLAHRRGNKVSDMLLWDRALLAVGARQRIRQLGPKPKCGISIKDWWHPRTVLATRGDDVELKSCDFFSSRSIYLSLAWRVQTLMRSRHSSCKKSKSQ